MAPLVLLFTRNQGFATARRRNRSGEEKGVSRRGSRTRTDFAAALSACRAGFAAVQQLGADVARMAGRGGVMAMCGRHCKTSASGTCQEPCQKSPGHSGLCDCSPGECVATDGTLSFGEAIQLLAKGEVLECNESDGHGWRRMEWQGPQPWQLYGPQLTAKWRRVPKKTRVQEMAEAFFDAPPRILEPWEPRDLAEFGERVVREVCERIRCVARGYHDHDALVADEIEREFLGGKS